MSGGPRENVVVRQTTVAAASAPIDVPPVAVRILPCGTTTMEDRMNKTVWILLAGVALAAAAPRTAAASPCSGDAYLAACKALNRKVSEVCPTNTQFKLSAGSEEERRAELGRWLARLAAFEKMPAELDEWKRQYGACEKKAGCSNSNAADACKRASDAYKTAWRGYEDFFTQVQVPQARRIVDQEKAQKKPPTEPGNRLLDGYLVEAQLMRELAGKISWIGGRPQALDGHIAEIEVARKQVTELQESRLSSASCPPATNPDKKLTGETRAALQKAWANREDKKFVETIKQFGLTGKTFQQRAPLDSNLQEFVNAVACVEQVYPDATNCRIMNVQFRRIKPDGGRWNDWEIFTTTGGELLACKNLK
jgi:hypothetical protein